MTGSVKIYDSLFCQASGYDVGGSFHDHSSDLCNRRSSSTHPYMHIIRIILDFNIVFKNNSVKDQHMQNIG